MGVQYAETFRYNRTIAAPARIPPTMAPEVLDGQNCAALHGRATYLAGRRRLDGARSKRIHGMGFDRRCLEPGLKPLRASGVRTNSPGPQTGDDGNHGPEATQ